jgi:altronate hydrolase
MDAIQIHRNDTVAVALRFLEKGARITFSSSSWDTTGGGSAQAGNIICMDDIQPGHKIALCDSGAGEKIIKYGCPIGAASQAILAGSLVHTHNMHTLLAETHEYHWTPRQILSPAPSDTSAVPEIAVFRRDDGRIGIRNEVWIIPTVGCVNKTAEALAAWAACAFGDRYEGKVDGVFAWTHPYGCSQMGDDHETTRTILADLVNHPNAGAVLVLSLGCENNTLESFKEVLGAAADGERVRFLTTQQCEDELSAGKELLELLVAHAEKAHRESAPVSELVIGMKCGGSDGFSGITANALVGSMCDRFTDRGAAVILTEVPEMFGAEQILLDRCESKAVFDRTVRLINDFKDYFRRHQQTIYENPSPGNKAGGITTLEEKSCGCVQKGGGAVVRGVYRYGERLPAGSQGLVLLEGPGNDMVSTTALTAAGAHLILFTTGRGTPLGAPVPTIKIASNASLADKKANWIDFNAGRLLTDDAEEVRSALFQLILDVANGTVKTKNELNNYREIALFKNGITL